MAMLLKLDACAIIDLYQSEESRQDGRPAPIYGTLKSQSPVDNFGEIRVRIDDHRHPLEFLESWCGLPLQVTVYGEFSVYGQGKNSSMTLQVEAMEIVDKYGAENMAKMMAAAAQNGKVRRGNPEPEQK